MLSVRTRLSGLHTRLTRRVSIVLGVLTVGVQPAAAQTVPGDCTVPESFTPLFNLLSTLAELAFVAGIAIGTIGLLIAAIYMMAPGQDSTRRGKDIAKHVLIGSVLLLSANMIMTFLITQLGASLCT